MRIKHDTCQRRNGKKEGMVRKHVSHEAVSTKQVRSPSGKDVHWRSVTLVRGTCTISHLCSIIGWEQPEACAASA
jgi:hypothetical protein